MKKVVNFILYPNRIKILFFSIFFFVSVVGFVWCFSIKSKFVLFNIGVLILVLVFFLWLSFKVDKEKGSKTKIYVIISIVQVLIIGLLSPDMKNWQRKYYLDRPNLVVAKLNSYQNKFVFLPKKLSELESNKTEYLPFRTNIGTRILYQKISDEEYRLYFIYYNNNWYTYSSEDKKWYQDS